MHSNLTPEPQNLYLQDTITCPIQNSPLKILLRLNCLGMNLESLLIDSWQLDGVRRRSRKRGYDSQLSHPGD